MAGSDRDVGRFDRWAAGYGRDPLQQRLLMCVRAEMLKQVRGLGVTSRRVLEIGCETVALVQASAAALPFRGQAFDLAMSTASLHNWRDQRAGLAEVGRVSAPIGIFVFPNPHAIGYQRVIYALGRRRHRLHTRGELTGCSGRPGCIPVAGRPSSTWMCCGQFAVSPRLDGCRWSRPWSLEGYSHACW